MYFLVKSLIFNSYSQSIDGEGFTPMTERRSLNKDGFIRVKEDYQEEERINKSETIEPLLRSIEKKSKFYSHMRGDTKLYEYQIDPILEHGPGQLESLRDSKYIENRNYNRDYDRNDDVQTPRSLLKLQNNKSRLSQASYYSQENGKKTVRFAETAEGLLKSVPVDPTFNDSDFVYDMQYRI
jgi:hypothetical protein